MCGSLDHSAWVHLQTVHVVEISWGERHKTGKSTNFVVGDSMLGSPGRKRKAYSEFKKHSWVREEKQTSIW